MKIIIAIILCLSAFVLAGFGAYYLTVIRNFQDLWLLVVLITVCCGWILAGILIGLMLD